MTRVAPLAGPRRATLPRDAVVIAVAFVLGAAIVRLGETAARAVLLPLAAFVFAFVGGPLACIAGVVALIFTGLDRSVEMGIGPVDLGLADFLYLAVIVSVASRSPAPSGDLPSPTRRSALVTRSLALVLLVAGVGVLRTWLAHPSELSAALTSWLRLVQTFSLAWLVPLVVRSHREFRGLVLSMAAAGVLAVGTAAFSAPEGLLETLTGERRAGGGLNVNAFALVCALLTLITLFTRTVRSQPLRLLLVLVGLTGLVLSKSVSGGAAFFLALGIGFAFRSPRRHPRVRVLRAGVALAVVAVGLFAYVSSFRPGELPRSAAFQESAVAVRAMLARAGWEVFAQEPILGAGWRASSLPEVIGRVDIGTVLRDEFPTLPPHYFPDVTPTSVHNAYIQILAELGVVGALAVALLLVAVLRLNAQVRGRFPSGSRAAHLARFPGLALVAVAIWFNTNPVFGGQVETVAAATLIGMLMWLDRVGTGLDETHLREPMPVVARSAETR